MLLPLPVLEAASVSQPVSESCRTLLHQVWIYRVMESAFTDIHCVHGIRHSLAFAAFTGSGIAVPAP